VIMEALNRDENGTMLMQHLSGRPRVRRSAFRTPCIFFDRDRRQLV